MEEIPYSDIRILIADDVSSMRKILLSMLRALGYRNIAVAEDGLEAWSIIRGEKIDLVISDWNMPRMTGIELLHKIRSTKGIEDLPFIMVTGEVDEGSVAQAAEVEVDSYILKPFVPRDLDEKINVVLGRRKNPSDFLKLLNNGRELLNEGLYGEALKYFKAAVSLEGDKPVGHFYLGQLYEEQGDDVLAKAAFLKATSINPKYIRALDGLARIYEREEDSQRLYEVLRVLIYISPRNVDRLMRLGRLALLVGDKEQARISLSRVADMESKDEPLLHEIGRLFLDNDMIDDAERIFDTLLARNPQNQDYLNCSAELCRRTGKYEKARTLYMRALSMGEDETIHFNLARLYAEMGSRRLAEYHLESALTIKPGFKEARKLLDRLEVAISEFKAQKAAQQESS